MRPPARTIFCSAERLKACARTSSGVFSSPSPRIFTGRRDGFVGGKGVQHPDIHHRKIGAERIVEAAFGQTAMQRHLAAFEPEAARIPRAGFLSLVAPAGGLAQLRADAAADADFPSARAARRTQFVEFHDSTSTR
jgi:hypothetical protein